MEKISGIGKVSADKLLRHFKSVKNIQNATEKDLLEILNIKQIKALQTYFESQKGLSEQEAFLK